MRFGRGSRWAVLVAALGLGCVERAPVGAGTAALGAADGAVGGGGTCSAIVACAGGAALAAIDASGCAPGYACGYLGGWGLPGVTCPSGAQMWATTDCLPEGVPFFARDGGAGGSCNVTVTCAGDGTGAVTTVDESGCTGGSRCSWQPGDLYGGAFGGCNGVAAGDGIGFYSTCR